MWPNSQHRWEHRAITRKDFIKNLYLQQIQQKSIHCISNTIIYFSFVITLDGKTITTPYRNTLAVPTPALGFMVAAEFNRQQKYLKTGEMPMLALCRTAVDADI